MDCQRHFDGRLLADTGQVRRRDRRHQHHDRGADLHDDSADTTGGRDAHGQLHRQQEQHKTHPDCQHRQYGVDQGTDRHLQDIEQLHQLDIHAQRHRTGENLRVHRRHAAVHRQELQDTQREKHDRGCEVDNTVFRRRRRHMDGFKTHVADRLHRLGRGRRGGYILRRNPRCTDHHSVHRQPYLHAAESHGLWHKGISV